MALWVIAAATLLGLLFSTLHYALRDFSVVKLQDLAEKRGGRGSLDAILDDIPGHVLATGALRVICNVALTIGAVAGAGAFVPDEAGTLQIQTSRLVGAFVVASILIYTFALVLPMSIAEHAGERVVCRLSVLLRLTHLLAWPLRTLSIVDVAIRRLAGVEHMTDAEKIEDELISVVAEGEREGQLGETQRDMIEAVVDFRSRSVEEIMTPRTEVEGFEYTDDLMFIQRFVDQHGRSRIPVYQGDLDHIVGVLYVKDLIKFLGTDPAKFKLKPVLRKPVWVPETKPLMELLYELRSRKVHMAIVLDEYGGTTGLVTFEDLLEEIVGEIQDEYEHVEESGSDIVVDQDTRSAIIEARAYIADVNEALEAIGLEIPESEDYDTAGGFVLARLGHIPVAGESFQSEAFTIVVLAAEPTRVTKVRIEAVVEERGADDAEETRRSRQSRDDEPQQSSVQASPTVA
jgi:putative hemolysin